MTLTAKKSFAGDDATATAATRRERNLLTQLPYWHLEDGIVELRNRVFEVGFELMLPDSDFMGLEAMRPLGHVPVHRPQLHAGVRALSAGRRDYPGHGNSARGVSRGHHDR